MKLWIPYPLSDDHQRIENVDVRGNFNQQGVYREEEFGNTMLFLRWIRVEPAGIVLALVSGTLTSGLGYVLWYRALRGLTATRAAAVQLLVPVLAAVGGVVFLAERMSFRLVIASLVILGGVAMAILIPSATAYPVAEKSSHR